jgi:hypothetical protein
MWQVSAEILSSQWSYRRRGGNPARSRPVENRQETSLRRTPHEKTIRRHCDRSAPRIKPTCAAASLLRPLPALDKNR